MPKSAVVRSIGHFAPEGILSNADLEKIVDTSDEWIVQRTGMKERHKCSEDQTTSTIAIGAAKEALERGNLAATDLDLIICGTVTPDMLFPSVACLVQNAIGATNAGAMDISAACSGFIYSLSIGTAMIKSGQANRVLVIGADSLTKFTDYTDRGTCILFGDGGGAVILEGQENTDRGVLQTVLKADGSGAPFIDLEVGGSRFPACASKSADRRHHIYMAGNEVYRFAVKAMGDACVKCLEMAGMNASEVDLFVPHQANMRIIESAAKRLSLPDEKVFINVHKYGNTSGGSIPLSLYEADKEGRLKPGMVVMTVGFGAGLVWGANLIRW
jgi:3-oxoacyl-[acyl-carrier-protein] synthase-3